MLKYLSPQLPKVSMRIRGKSILAGVVIVLGIIIFVGGLRYTFDIIVNPPSEIPEAFAIGGAVGHLLGIGTVNLRYSNHPR